MGEPLITRLLVENLAPILAITGSVGFVALGPIGRALARRIEGQATGPGECGDLERRLMELEHQVARTAELEERLEFAERTLLQGREAGRLPGQGSS